MVTVTLHPQQLGASEPGGHRWVAASAGTGKTQVLSARVLRLLLSGARPESILCLTFTRAGAAEMQERVNGRLARWVRLNDGLLGAELKAMGEPVDPDTLARARRLFARVLDAGGGGLRVQTIHGFCQSLLASFPLESGLAPGFAIIGDDERRRLANATLTELLLADEGGALGDRIGALSVRLGEGAALDFLIRCAGAAATLAALPEGLRDWLRLAAGFTGSVADAMAAACADGAFPTATVAAYAAAVRACGGRDADAHADALTEWLALDAAARAGRLDLPCGAMLTAGGTPRAISRLAKREPEAEAWQAAICAALATVTGLEALAGWIDELAEALTAGRAFADAFTAAKRRAGLVDYDDLIAGAGELLGRSAMADWVRYTLDARIDHILVDEAQDTNVEQWRVVEALADEFFAGRDDQDAPVTRTLFAVGDFKQAIFGFQGTDPAAFAAARERFGARAQAVAAPFAELALTRSFRSTPAILRLVDAVVERLGADALGPDVAAARHQSATGGPGEVILAEPVAVPERAEAEESDRDEGWLDDADRRLAQRIARQVRAWIDGGLTVGHPPRPVRPGDIMVLARARGPYVPLLVARLHEEGVPVAGVDRLFLSAPLVVQDLLAAIRWVLQPEDDLALANLLVGPLIGWTQDELMARAVRGEASLWRHLRDTRPEAELAPLRDLLARADFVAPYEFLERMLSGPLGGRAKLLARLGREALDPLEELLNAAVLFEATEPPGLQRFLHWIERSASEIKREQAEAGDAVRVLTVHGAKGLEAPVVILADATRDPDAGHHGRFEWRLSEAVRLPALPPRGAEASGAIADAVAANAAREAAEHRRLLYVALTRARERLLVVGKAPARGGVPASSSWHAAVDAGLDALGVEWEDDPLWGRVRRFADDAPWIGRGAAAAARVAAEVVAPPDWLRRPAPPEARPPRPLAPSRLGADDAADRPLGPARAEAIERGLLLHALFERLPPVAPERRREAGVRWLAARRGVDQARAAELTDAALAVIELPDWARLWGLQALAEAPLSAVVDGEVVAGTVDRLVVTDDLVEVVDFKTGLALPASSDEVPAAYLRQMAAYREALRAMFPDRPVRAALLYTAAPRWFDLPDALLDGHKPGSAGDNKV